MKSASHAHTNEKIIIGSHKIKDNAVHLFTCLKEEQKPLNMQGLMIIEIIAKDKPHVFR